MRHRPLVVAAALAGLGLCAGGHTAHADREKGVIGVGIALGEPSGVSGKIYLSNDTAVDALIGFGIVEAGFSAHADLLWHPFVLATEESFALPFYFGGGIRILQESSRSEVDNFRIGGRLPVGIVFDFTTIPLDVFAEVAGIVDFVLGDDGGIEFEVNGGIGARYYF